MAPNARRMWLLGAAAVLIAVCAAFLWLQGRSLYWTVVSGWPLDAEEQARLGRCEDPGWVALLKVLEQDLDVPCEPLWFLSTAEPYLGKGRTLRVQWLHGMSRDKARPLRSRFRAGGALVLSGRSGPDALTLWTQASRLLPARSGLIQALQDGTWPVAAADPDLRLAVQGDELADAPEALLDRLQEERLSQGDRASVRAALTEQGLGRVGLDAGRLELALRRHDEGLSQRDLPPGAERLVINRGSACLDRGSTACLELVIDLLQAAADDAEGEGIQVTDPVELPVLFALWRVAWADDVSQARAREQRAQRWLSWLQEVPGEARAERLLAMVSATAGESDQAPPADPAEVMRLHRGRPWAVALVAQEMGTLAGVPVSAGVVDRGLELEVGGQRVHLDACGRVARVDVEAAPQPPVAWPIEAVLAQAGLELADAITSDRAPAAARLRRWAYGLDPVGVAAPAALDGLDGALAGAARPPVHGLTGALDARSTMSLAPLAGCVP